MLPRQYFSTFCPHRSSAALDSDDIEAGFFSVFPGISRRDDADDKIAVIPTDEAPHVRFHALSCIVTPPVAIRGQSCLDCCLKLCHKVGCNILLL